MEHWSKLRVICFLLNSTRVLIISPPQNIGLVTFKRLSVAVWASHDTGPEAEAGTTVRGWSLAERGPVCVRVSWRPEAGEERREEKRGAQLDVKREAQSPSCCDPDTPTSPGLEATAVRGQLHHDWTKCHNLDVWGKFKFFVFSFYLFEWLKLLWMYVFRFSNLNNASKQTLNGAGNTSLTKWAYFPKDLYIDHIPNTTWRNLINPLHEN